MINDSIPRALAVTADQGLARRLRAELAGQAPLLFTLSLAGSETEALAALGQGSQDLVLVDLDLDPEGLGLCSRLAALAGGAALVLLGASAQEELGWQAVREGAQDFICPAETSPAALRRACRHAVERQRIHNALAPPARLPSLAPPSPSPEHEAGEGPQGERLVLVDDEAGVADITQRGLTRLGFQVRSWVRPLEAWEWMRSHQADFDLLITDLTMPDMGGLELVQRVAGLRPNLPIILWTGYQDLLRLGGGAPPEVDEVLAKPVTVAELGQAVRRALDSR